jgi:hypothetical protein
MGMTAMSQLSWNEERRSTPRHRTLKSARIVIDPKLPALEGIVRNLSPGGALLLVPSLAVPDRFELVFATSGTHHTCKVVWRAPDRVGVAFMSA